MMVVVVAVPNTKGHRPARRCVAEAPRRLEPRLRRLRELCEHLDAPVYQMILID